MTDIEDLKGKTFSWNNRNRNVDNNNEAEYSDRQVDDDTHNAITILQISPELMAAGIKQISYSEKFLIIDDCDGNSTQTDLDKDSISKTLANFDNLVNGTFNDSLKKAIKLFIAEAWEDIGTKTSNTEGSDVGDDGDDESGNSQGKATKAQLIIPVVKPHLNKLFTDEYGIPHAGIDVDGHIEVLKLSATRFKNWVRRTT
jgi:hypothetical protein